MIEVIRVTCPNCDGCFGASFGDCTDCKVHFSKVVLCKDCTHNRQDITLQDKSLCSKLHIWVESTGFCAWGKGEK